MKEISENKKDDTNINLKEMFPDKTKIDKWFYDTTIPDINKYKKYYIDEYCTPNTTEIQTEKIQKLIDNISNTEKEGGLLVIKGGFYYSGSLFLKNNVNLYIEKDSKLI